MVDTRTEVMLITTGHGTITLTISEEHGGSLEVISEADAIESGEAAYQLKEGYAYEYQLTDGYRLERSGIVNPSKIHSNSGRITPSVYVGKLEIDVIKADTNTCCGKVRLEVRSVKASYRTDYRLMLEDITEKCTDLLLQHSSPASQYFEVNFDADARTLYQRFAFLRSILDAEEFNNAVHKVLSNPVTTWAESAGEKDIRAIRKVNSSVMRQMASGTNRVELPQPHPLRKGLSSAPARVQVQQLKESVDAPVNRFVKYVLTSFLSFIGDLKVKLKKDDRMQQEVILLEEKLEQWLHHSMFREIADVSTCPLNNPVLQRKEGYREILRVWLMFDLAAKLVWHGGDDVYDAGKRDVAVLYEYWLFFKLLEVVEGIFKITPTSIEELIKPTNDGLGLQLRQGNHLLITGIYDTGPRKLNIQFSYNRRFRGGSEYPDGGSWSHEMRPDYTLSFYPIDLKPEDAEKQELITHIHFDAKYKVEKLEDIFNDDEDKENNGEENNKRNKSKAKREDLLKMHTYRDAIRRTAGAYVLYPGDRTDIFEGFHELIPGLGAFVVKPSTTNNGIQEVKAFIERVVKHFMDRTSHREKMALRTYQTYKDNKNKPFEESLPEVYGNNRSLLPDETFVLVGYYREEQLNWILQNKLYNIRIEDLASLNLSPQMAGAQYLLLHGSKKETSNKLFKLKAGGPTILSRNNLIKKGYPSPSRDFYFVFEIADEVEKEFEKRAWNVRGLPNYKGDRKNKGRPFVVSIVELVNVIVSNS